MYEIEIANRQTCLEIDEERVRAVVTQTLASETVAEAQISIALLDNKTIRELNRKHLEHDFETDVLSFLFDRQHAESSEETLESPQRGPWKRIEGEVVVSAEMAAGRAAEFQWTPHDELVLYVVHGLLHLVGYDDQSESDRACMRSREREIMKHLESVSGCANAAGDFSGTGRCHPDARSSEDEF